MNSRKRLIVIGVLVVGASVLALTLLRGGGQALLTDTRSAIEQWCGKQLLAIANAHLRPELTFDKLQFELPATVTLTNIRLLDQNIAVIEARSMRIEFTETPKVGQPIVIQNIDLTEPVVRLIQREHGGMQGLSELIEKPTGDRTEDGTSTRLSDIFAIRHINVTNGSISLELLGQPAMVLDQLTTGFTSTPAVENESQKGWYVIDARLSRRQVLDWALNGRLNIDSGLLDIGDMRWSMVMGEQQYPTLPPDVQKFIRDHEMTGELKANLKGMLSLRDVAQSKLDMQASLTNGRMVIDEYIVPVQSLEAIGNVSSGVITLKPVTLTSLGGTAQIDGTWSMLGEQAFTLNANVSGMRIEQALKQVEQQTPKYAGRVDMTGAISGQGRSDPAALVGGGHFTITEGRLIQVPALARINEIIAGMNAAESSNDTGSANWKLFGNRVNFTNLEVIGSAIAARGEGDIMFDSTINFRVNAGPLEKAQSALGVVGEMVGKVTDKIVQYEITGRLGEPIVTVKTLGLDLGLGN